MDNSQRVGVVTVLVIFLGAVWAVTDYIHATPDPEPTVHLLAAGARITIETSVGNGSTSTSAAGTLDRVLPNRDGEGITVTVTAGPGGGPVSCAITPSWFDVPVSTQATEGPDATATCTFRK